MKTREEIEAMTDEERRIKTAELCGTMDRWVLRKRGLFYCPDAKGYTSDIRDAWILTEAEANKHVYPHDKPVTKHRAPMPDYLNSLDAMHEALKTMPDELYWPNFYDTLAEVVRGYVQRDIMEATARHRNEAFLMVMLP